MNINIQAKNIELTEAIRDYVEKKVTDLGKVLSKIEEEGKDVLIHFEVGKSTKHHKSGEYFHTDCSVNISGDKYYASADEEDLYEAIDVVKDLLFKEISHNKDRKQTLFTRGARSVKKMLKGISRRNSDTGKY